MESLGILLTDIGLLIFLVGIAMAIIGIILTMVKRSRRDRQQEESQGEGKKGRVRGGGVIVFGPVPIVFGTDRGAILIAAGAAIALMILYLMLLQVS